MCGRYEQPDATLVSDELRAAGANVFAINMESVAGGCEEADLDAAVAEQATAKEDFPGPLPIVWMDAVLDEVQLARAAVGGAEAVTLNLETLGVERCNELKSVAEDKYGLEALIVCAPRAAGAEGLVPLMQQAETTSRLAAGEAPSASRPWPAVKEMKSDDLVLIARSTRGTTRASRRRRRPGTCGRRVRRGLGLGRPLRSAPSRALFASSPDTITSVVKAMSPAGVHHPRVGRAFRARARAPATSDIPCACGRVAGYVSV